MREKTYEFSRLAWCYGDLGIGIAIYQAAVVLNNIEWKQFAFYILNNCAKRRNLKNNLVDDAGVCHGTSGIGLVFYRMFKYTGNIVFKESAEYWFEQTKNILNNCNGLENYEVWKSGFGWVKKDESFLEGNTGIRVVLHYWENNIDPDWDSCLLLS